MKPSSYEELDYAFVQLMLSLLFFINHTPTTEIYTLSLHDALPISRQIEVRAIVNPLELLPPERELEGIDRKSTRLNSSHPSISYAVFCLKKKIEGGSLEVTRSQVVFHFHFYFLLCHRVE